MDREKVVNAVKTAFDVWIDEYTGCSWFKEDEVRQAKEDALSLLKEQEDLGTELTNAVELIHKKNERIEKLLKQQEAQKFLVDESGKITPLPVVVCCKDCVHRGKAEKCVLAAISEEKDCPLFMLDNRGEWYCADGVRAEGR